MGSAVIAFSRTSPLRPCAAPIRATRTKAGSAIRPLSPVGICQPRFGLRRRRGASGALGRRGSGTLLSLLARNRLLRIVARAAFGEAGGIEEAKHPVGGDGAL